MNLTLPFLVATTDFLTAVDLGKTYPEINNSKEVIGKFTEEFQLPNNGIATLEELEKVLVDNLFTEAIPASLKLRYWQSKYFFVDAMRLAAANNDVEFLKEYREHFDCFYLIEAVEIISHILHNTALERRFYFLIDEIRFLSKHGYLEKILVSNLHGICNKEVYIEEILRNEKWKLFADVSKNNFECLKLDRLDLQRINGAVFTGLLALKNIENLQNPPKEITSLKDWKVDPNYYANLNTNFPICLPNKEFVDYFKEQISNFSSDDINQLSIRFEPIAYYEGFKAIIDLFPKGEIHLNKGIPFTRHMSPQDENSIAMLFGNKEGEYHEYILSRDHFEDEIMSYHPRIMELVRLKYKPEVIRKYIKQYLDIYPDPILRRELEKLEKLDETNSYEESF